LLKQRKKMQHGLCALLICLGVSQLTPVSMLFAEEADVVIGTVADGRKLYRATKQDKRKITNFGIGTASSSIRWQGIYSTPMIKLDDVGFVYCIEPTKAVPQGNTYSAGIPVTDAGVQSLLAAGFPHNSGDLTAEEAYVRTFVALNAYLGTFNRRTVERFGDAYVNHLLQRADEQTAQSNVIRIVEPESVEAVYNEATKRNETDFYAVDGVHGEYTFEDLPQHVYAVDESGQRGERFKSGSKFRLVSESIDLDETVTFKVKTEQKTLRAMRYEAHGVQNLVALEGHQDVALATARIILKPSKLPEIGTKKKPEEKVSKKENKKKEPVERQQQAAKKQPTLVKTGSASQELVVGLLLLLGGSSIFVGRKMRHVLYWRGRRFGARVKE